MIIVYRNLDGTVGAEHTKPLGSVFVRGESFAMPMRGTGEHAGVPFYGIDRSVLYTRTYRRKAQLSERGDVWFFDEEVGDNVPAYVLQRRFEECEAAWLRLGAVVERLEGRSR